MHDSLVSPDIVTPATNDHLRVSINHECTQSASVSANADVSLLRRYALTQRSETLWKHDWWVTGTGYFEESTLERASWAFVRHLLY